MSERSELRGAVVVLAAGRAERFGTETKQLAQLGDRPLVRHVVDAAVSAGIGSVTVVLGHEAAAVAAVLPNDPRVHVVVNPSFEKGQASSLRAGLGALPSDVEFAVLLLADQPRVQAEAIRAVASSIQAGARVARAAYSDGQSHPVAFRQDVWPELMAIEGDQGARVLFDSLDVIRVPVTGPRPVDIDTREELVNLEGSPRVAP